MPPTVFPGHGPWFGVEFQSGTLACRGSALVALDEFFLNEVSLATEGTHASHHTRRDEHGVHVFGSTVPLADNMCRQLCIEAHASRVCIERIRWLDALPGLDALHGVVHLRIADLDITTLPSLSPLVNLLELHLENLFEMRELPDAICDAPQLSTLQLRMLLRLRAVPDALVRRLAAKAAPLRVLGMARCACEVPAGIDIPIACVLIPRFLPPIRQCFAYVLMLRVLWCCVPELVTVCQSLTGSTYLAGR